MSNGLVGLIRKADLAMFRAALTLSLLITVAGFAVAQAAPDAATSAVIQAITSQQNPDPNFAGIGRDLSFTGRALFSWMPNQNGMPMVMDLRRGRVPTVYLGYDRAGVSYLSGQSPYADNVYGPKILAVFNHQIHYLMEAPPGLMKPSQIAGLNMHDVDVLSVAVSRQMDRPNFVRQFTPRPGSENADFDPNFYGSGENVLFAWGGTDEGRPQIYSNGMGTVDYLGFDKATGNSYLKIQTMGNCSYSAKITNGPLKPVKDLPANLSQPPSKKQRLSSDILQKVQLWQKTAGPNKDPNFIGNGEDEYFEWQDIQHTGVPTVSSKHANATSYLGYDETTGYSYLSMGTGMSFFSYFPGRGRPIPAAELPAHLSNVPPSLKGRPQMKGVTATTIAAAPAKPDLTSGTGASVSHVGSAWSVTFVDESGKKQTLPMARPHLARFTKAIWDDLNANHLGMGMWLASDAATGMVRVIDVKVNDRYGKPALERVNVAPPKTMAEVVQFIQSLGVTVLDSDPE